MEKIIRDVRDIDGAEGQALPTGDHPKDEIPEWWKVYEGLSDAEVDRLDAAIRGRAELTRIFE